MAEIEVVERGYRAVASGDRVRLGEAFTDDAVWRLMDRAEIVRTYEGREAVVEFLLRFRDLRLEAITQARDVVVAAHSFTLKGETRAIATTLYEFRGGLVAAANCSDVMREKAVAPRG